MSRSEKAGNLAGRIEYFMRRLFERIGGALDFALRRPLNPQPRTDLSALVPPIERAIEERLRREPPRVLAPNLIELRYDYETYSGMGQARVGFLQRELRATVYEYIHNRRYATLGEVQVKIGFDVFTRQLMVRALYPGEGRGAGAPRPEPGARRPGVRGGEVRLRVGGRELRARAASDGGPVGVGRGHDNLLMIDDATVSNFHAAFTLAADDALWLADLGSSNGTFVNGVRLPAGEKSLVRAGDRLRFGEVEAVLGLDETEAEK